MVMETAMKHRDLFRSIDTIVPELPVPRIQIMRWFGSKGGFSTARQAYWTVTAFGLNGQQLPKEDETVGEKDAEHIAAQWKALLGWPIVRLRTITQTQTIIEFEPEEDGDE